MTLVAERKGAVRAERRRILRGLMDPNPGMGRLLPVQVNSALPTVANGGITFGAVNGSSTLAGKNFKQTTNVFRILGATLTAESTWGKVTQVTQRWAAEFEIDCSAFEVQTQASTSAAKFRLIVDGVYNTLDHELGQTGGGGAYYLKVNFGSQAVRHVVIEGDATWKFGGVYVANTDHVWRSQKPLGPVVAFLGDSLTEGAYTNTSAVSAPIPLNGWATKLAQGWGWLDYQQSGSGGTGYLNPNAGAGRVKFRDRVQADIIARGPDIVFAMGGYNDMTYDPGSGVVTAAQIGAEAGLLFAAIRAGLPNAILIVLGEYYPNGSPTQTVINTNQAIMTAATGIADLIIDPIKTTTPGANTLGFMTGTGKEGSTNGGGVSDRYVCSDGTHMTKAGYAYWARRVAQEMAAALPFAR